jgi:hypothetical protein
LGKLPANAGKTGKNDGKLVFSGKKAGNCNGVALNGEDSGFEPLEFEFSRFNKKVRRNRNGIYTLYFEGSKGD